MAVAVAVEFVHAASLVLDDLPSMDDARRRRGRPALHRVYGVATAELAAVALLSRAFEVLALAKGFSAAARARAVGELAAAVGASGCCAGQAADLGADPSRESMGLDDLEAIHAQKTGALFVAAVRGGALAGSAGERTLEGLSRYARNLGLAFQITDDVLDLVGDEADFGKTVGRDLAEGMPTLPMIYAVADADGHAADLARRIVATGKSDGEVRELLGVIRASGGPARARERALEFHAAALKALDALPARPEREALRDVADFVVSRVR